MMSLQAYIEWVRERESDVSLYDASWDDKVLAKKFGCGYKKSSIMNVSSFLCIICIYIGVAIYAWDFCLKNNFQCEKVLTKFGKSL